jgi:hypothetical protein
MQKKAWVSPGQAFRGLIINKAVNIYPAEHFGVFSGSGGKEFFKSECF